MVRDGGEGKTKSSQRNLLRCVLQQGLFGGGGVVVD